MRRGALRCRQDMLFGRVVVNVTERALNNNEYFSYVSDPPVSCHVPYRAIIVSVQSVLAGWHMQLFAVL